MDSRALAHLEQAIVCMQSDDRPYMAFGANSAQVSPKHSKQRSPKPQKSSKKPRKAQPLSTTSKPEKMPVGMHDMYVQCLVRQKSRMEGAGKGVFATCDIKADTLIGRYRGVPIYSRIYPGKIMNFDEHRRAQFNRPEDRSDDPHRREYTMCDCTNTPKGEMIDGWPCHPESNWIPLINGTMTGDQTANVEVINCEEATVINNKTKQIRSMVGKELKGVWYKALVEIKASPKRKVELVTDYGRDFFNELRTLREIPPQRKHFDPTAYDKKRKSA